MQIMSRACQILVEFALIKFERYRCAKDATRSGRDRAVRISENIVKRFESIAQNSVICTKRRSVK